MGVARTPPVLTARQLEVLRLRALGLTVKEAAHELHVEHHTIRNHTSAAFRRSSARCMADVWRAIGWLRVPAA